MSLTGFRAWFFKAFWGLVYWLWFAAACRARARTRASEKNTAQASPNARLHAPQLHYADATPKTRQPYEGPVSSRPLRFPGGRPDPASIPSQITRQAIEGGAAVGSLADWDSLQGEKRGREREGHGRENCTQTSNASCSAFTLRKPSLRPSSLGRETKTSNRVSQLGVTFWYFSL